MYQQLEDIATCFPLVRFYVSQSSIIKYELSSTLCKYDLRKGDLCVLRWARVR